MTDETTPAPKPSKPAAPKFDNSDNPSPVVSDAERDEVHLSALSADNRSRKSLSVHHLQRRLAELGYGEAYADIDGSYGALTQNSVRAFQADSGLDSTGVMDEATFTAIFKRDAWVDTKLD